MQTALDCLPCFMRQALYTARIATADTALQKEILDQAARLLTTFDLGVSPPENAVALYGMIAEAAGCPDPFIALKDESNRLALELAPMAREQIASAADPLAVAIKFAIAGNIIDYGAHHDFDARKTINTCLERQLAINDGERLRKAAEQAKSILFLADNCGELVFDTLLIEQLGPEKVTVAVKGRPIINDALLADAKTCGIDNICAVIDNGTACPGTPLSQCSAAFQKAFANADLIVSKGQGNFETLSESAAPIFFLFTVKCAVAVQHVNALAGGQRVKSGDMVLMQAPATNR
ncbi:MAG: ARMT1-like domain-containing protein [Desulfobulbaceae bacterium]|nr:ARMT1-like domain-containing protein [Desulfobulbaceae bacterium]